MKARLGQLKVRLALVDGGVLAACTLLGVVRRRGASEASVVLEVLQSRHCLTCLQTEGVTGAILYDKPQGAAVPAVITEVARTCRLRDLCAVHRTDIRRRISHGRVGVGAGGGVAATIAVGGQVATIHFRGVVITIVGRTAAAGGQCQDQEDEGNSLRNRVVVAHLSLLRRLWRLVGNWVALGDEVSVTIT